MKQTNEEIFLRSKSDVLYFSSLTKLYLKDQNFWSMRPVRLQYNAKQDLNSDMALTKGLKTLHLLLILHSI